MNTDAPPHPTEDSAVLVGRWFYALVTLGFLLLTAAFFLRTRSFPMCCDAAGYHQLGQSIGSKGLTGRLVLSDIRTIGYPALIALVAWLPLPFGLDSNVVLVQALLYWLAATLLLRASRRVVAGLGSRRALAIGLLANPIAAMYCAEILTESLSLTLFLACMATALAAQGHPLSPRRRYSIPFLLGLLAGLALIVRPANLALVAATICTMAFPPLATNTAVRRRLLKAATSVVAACVGVYVAISPQIAVNLKLFDQASPFPTAHIGDLQLHEGIRHMKYATFVGTPGAKPMHYANPLVQGTILYPKDTYAWYLRNPAHGLCTLAGHVFATLAQEPFYTYVRDLDPWYRIPVALLNGLVVVFGLGWLGRQYWRGGRSAMASPPAWFLLSSLVCSLGIGAFSAPESRFGALALLVCLASTCIATARTIAASRPPRLLWLALGVAGSLVFAIATVALGRLAKI